VADDQPPIRRGDYHLARSIVALLFAMLLGVLLAYEAVAAEYQLNERVFWALLGSILLMLGFEGVDLLKGRRR
jgi:uncharacterized membrane protein YjfL (UPF0719 family)